MRARSLLTLVARVAVTRDLERLAERRRDRPVAILARMLIDQRCSRRGVAHPGHQFLEARSSRRRQRVTDVPEIMRVQIWQTDVGSDLVPDAPEA